MFVHRSFLIKHRLFVVMVMVSMRLRGEPKGESHYIQKNCNIRNLESILHIIFLMSGVQTWQFSQGKRSAYRLKQLQRNLWIGNLLIGRNIARTNNRLALTHTLKLHGHCLIQGVQLLPHKFLTTSRKPHFKQWSQPVVHQLVSHPRKLIYVKQRVLQGSWLWFPSLKKVWWFPPPYWILVCSEIIQLFARLIHTCVALHNLTQQMQN